MGIAVHKQTSNEASNEASNQTHRHYNEKISCSALRKQERPKIKVTCSEEEFHMETITHSNSSSRTSQWKSKV